MHRVYVNINDALPDLAGYVLDGEEVGSRGGERVMERLHETVTLTEPKKRYMLLPQRRASLPAQIAETMWVLAGRDDVEWLSNYLPRAPQFSDDGEVWRGAYGPRLRSSGEALLDQVDYVVDLLKRDHTSRRAVIQIYNADIDSQAGKDIPCNDFISFQSRLGELHMHVFVRSNDLVWGWSGINTFEWSVLQEVIASILGIGVGKLTFATSSLHIYDRHWKKMRALSESYPAAGLTPWDAVFDVPEITSIRSMTELDMQLREWFKSEALIRKAGSYGNAVFFADEADVDPLFKDWLRVIAAWWWRADDPQVESRTLRAALAVSPERKVKAEIPTLSASWTEQFAWSAFVARLDELQKTKHESYGDSWKKRGETLGILANIARKTDRLGKTDDYETALDTAADLLIYLIKYKLFLYDLSWDTDRSDSSEQVSLDLQNTLLEEGYLDSRDVSAEELAGRLNEHMLEESWVSGNTVVSRHTEVLNAQNLAAHHLYKLWKGQNK